MSGNCHCLYDYFHIQMVFKYPPNYLIVMDEIMLSFFFRMYQRLVRIWRKSLDLFLEIVVPV
jgi:hypothetical protein